MNKNKPIDIMNDDKLLGLAARYAFFRDFYSWVKGDHPEICEEYLKILKENDDIMKKVRKL